MAIRDKGIIFFVIASALLILPAYLVLAAAPSITSVTLNATDNPRNTSNANLTAYPYNVTDADGDNVSFVYDWRLNGTSIAVLNMNFDVNDSAGTGKTKDYSMYGNNGTLGASTAAPRWNASGGWNSTGVYLFDGGDHINMSDSSSLDLGSPLTLSAWVYFDSLAGWQTIMSKRSDSGNCALFYFQKASDAVSPPNRFALTLRDSGSDACAYAGTTSVISTTTAETGKWYFVTATYDGSFLRMYVNGVNENSTSYSGAIPTSNDDVLIGAGEYAQSIVDNVRGRIDEAMIFNRTLSAAEISALYNNRSDLLVSDETSMGENWSVCVTPNDGTADGSETCSNTLEVQNGAPSISSVVLNATDNPRNTSNANLTAYVSASDPESDDVSFVYDWRLNGTSIAVLNMNFDVNDSAGTGKTKDYSMYGNNGTLGAGTTAPTWNATGGWNGTGAYEFDGSDDYISLGTSTTITDLGNATVALWVKVNKFDPSGSYRILGIGSGATNRFAIIPSGSGGNHFGFYNDIDDSNDGKFEPAGRNTGEWYHVAVTFGSGGIKLYVNGVEENSSSSMKKFVDIDGTPEIRLGKYSYTDAGFFNGTIDDVRIFNRTLSANQILALYNKTVPTCSSATRRARERTGASASRRTTAGLTGAKCAATR